MSQSNTFSMESELLREFDWQSAVRLFGSGESEKEDLNKGFNSNTNILTFGFNDANYIMASWIDQLKSLRNGSKQSEFTCASAENMSFKLLLARRSGDSEYFRIIATSFLILSPWSSQSAAKNRDLLQSFYTTHQVTNVPSGPKERVDVLAFLLSKSLQIMFSAMLSQLSSGGAADGSAKARDSSTDGRPSDHALAANNSAAHSKGTTQAQSSPNVMNLPLFGIYGMHGSVSSLRQATVTEAPETGPSSSQQMRTGMTSSEAVHSSSVLHALQSGFKRTQSPAAADMAAKVNGAQFTNRESTDSSAASAAAAAVGAVIVSPSPAATGSTMPGFPSSTATMSAGPATAARAQSGPQAGFPPSVMSPPHLLPPQYMSGMWPSQNASNNGSGPSSAPDSTQGRIPAPGKETCDGQMAPPSQMAAAAAFQQQQYPPFMMPYPAAAFYPPPPYAYHPYSGGGPYNPYYPPVYGPYGVPPYGTVPMPPAHGGSSSDSSSGYQQYHPHQVRRQPQGMNDSFHPPPAADLNNSSNSNDGRLLSDRGDVSGSGVKGAVSPTPPQHWPRHNLFSAAANYNNYSYNGYGGYGLPAGGGGGGGGQYGPYFVQQQHSQNPHRSFDDSEAGSPQSGTSNVYIRSSDYLKQRQQQQKQQQTDKSEVDEEQQSPISSPPRHKAQRKQHRGRASSSSRRRKKRGSRRYYSDDEEDEDDGEDDEEAEVDDGAVENEEEEDYTPSPPRPKRKYDMTRRNAMSQAIRAAEMARLMKANGTNSGGGGEKPAAADVSGLNRGERFPRPTFHAMILDRDPPVVPRIIPADFEPITSHAVTLNSRGVAKSIGDYRVVQSTTVQLKGVDVRPNGRYLVQLRAFMHPTGKFTRTVNEVLEGLWILEVAVLISERPASQEALTRSGNYHAIAEIMAMLAPILMASPGGGEDEEQSSASSSSRRARTSGQYSQAVTATSSPYEHTPYEHYAMLLRYVLEFHRDSKVFSPELMEIAVQNFDNMKPPADVATAPATTVNSRKTAATATQQPATLDLKKRRGGKTAFFYLCTTLSPPLGRYSQRQVARLHSGYHRGFSLSEQNLSCVRDYSVVFHQVQTCSRLVLQREGFVSDA